MIDICQQIIHHPQSLIKATFSVPLSKGEVQRVVLRPVALKKGLFLQVVSYFSKKVITKNIAHNDIANYLETLFCSYENASIEYTDCIYYVYEKTKIRKRIKSTRTACDLSHNRKKTYIIPEGVPCDFLIALDIMNAEGSIKPGMRDKFIQINTFLALIKPLVETLSRKNNPLTIIDFGCGKAYLSFALYYYLSKSYTVTLRGFDLKKEVIEYCSQLARDLHYTGLHFTCQDIRDTTLRGPVDAVFSLHVCDVATDWAIYQAVRLQAQVIAVAPCCQHEISQQIAKDALPLLLKHGILKERFSALLTDSIRAELLERSGYNTDVVEFVDSVHTPKNIMIRAQKKKGLYTVDSQELEKMLELFRIQPTLTRLIPATKS